MAGNTVQIKFEAISNFSNVINNVKQIQNALRGIKLPDKVGDRLEKNINGVVLSMEKLQQQSKRGFTKPGDVAAYEKELQKADTMLNKMVKDLGSLSGKDLLKLNIDTTQIIKLKQQVSEVKKEMASGIKGAMLDPSNNLKGAFSGMEQILGKGSKTKAIYDSLVTSINKGDFSGAQAQWEKLTQYMTRYNSQKLDTAQWDTMKTAMKAALSAGTTEAQRFLPILDKLDKEIQDAVNVEQGNIESTIRGAGDAAQSTATQFGNLRQKEDEAANGMLSMNQQMSQLKTQANYFFSLQNMFQLLKRGIQDAFETVKNLDKAMTETAVVTDFSVGDMWAALPEYTKLANKLGATTQGAYETMTLYYQQGLDKEQAFGLGEETMKMARIAGLDYAETTNMMTAALRGFNMELDNTSAKRINDVYSQLAAKTASDTYELGSAMERTASIAHSANMSFESTTAFLAQMIETTREAPENLGTAMKTIIARFQELKENPYEISEVEGEEVNYNRIDKALKTIGVDLVDNRDKFRDLDDVFMDIAEKWDGLSQTQQRYIATIAAGSRQQSRFIAMVGNYKRVSELTEAANNAAGASNVQFAKTLDSIEAKLNKLKNAWDLFLMGITNSGFLKGAVDIGTTIIDTINDVIDAVSKFVGIGDTFEGLTKSVLSLGAAFVGLKLGGKLVNIGLGGVANLIDPKRSGGMFAGVTGRRDAAGTIQAEKISNPIVTVLKQILSVVSKREGLAVASDENSNSRLVGADWKNRQKEFKKMMGQESFSVNNLLNSFNGMDVGQQQSMFNSNKWMKANIKDAFLKQFEGLDLSTTGKRQAENYINGMLSGMSSGKVVVQNGLKEMFNSSVVAEKVGGELGTKITEKTRVAMKAKESSPMGRMINREPVAKGENYGAMIKGASAAQMAVSGVANGVNALGQAIMSVGMIVDTVVPGAGTAFMAFGTIISSVGGLISTLSIHIGKIGKALKTAFSFMYAHPLILALTVAAGLIAVIAASHKKAIKEIRKDAKQVAKDYEKSIDETTKNLNKLNEARENFATLAQGVDKNGNNVNLGAEEYADYQKTVREIVKMNPELIRGYNAQGEAIIDNNTALTEAIRLQEKEQKIAKQEYTSTASLQKLIDSRNTKKRFKNNVIDYQNFETSQSDIKKSAEDFVEKANKLGVGDILLKYNIDPDSALTPESLKILQNQGSDINEAMQRALENVDDIDQAQLTGLSDAMADLGKHTKDFQEVVEETHNNLIEWANVSGITNMISDEFQSGFQIGLKSIAEQDLSAGEMHSAARRLATSFDDLMGHGEQYKNILKDVEEAQQDFAKTGDKAAYNNNTTLQKDLDNLRNWQQQAEDIFHETGDVIYQAMSDSLTNTIASIDGFTKNGSALLEESVNTFAADITRVNKSFETFQKQIEGRGDFYTGRENVAQIFEAGYNKKDKAGRGSMTYWASAEELFGEDIDIEKSKKQVDAMFKTIKPALKEGRKGTESFLNMIQKVQSADVAGTGKTVADFIKVTDTTVDFKMNGLSDEDFKSLAEAIGISDDALTALLNNARQFYRIDFSNPEGIRSGLELQDSTIISDRTNKNKQNLLYTRKSAYKQTLKDQGLTGKDLKEALKEAPNNGIKLVEEANKITGKNLQTFIKDWKINEAGSQKASMESVIQKFSQLGYDKEEIYDIIQTAESNNLLTNPKANYNEKYQETQQSISENYLQDISGINQGILNNTDAIALKMGVLTQASIDAGKKEERAVIGGEGKDTVFERFGELKNANGVKITSASEYESMKEMTQKELDNANLQLDRYKEAKKEAETSAEKEAIQAEIDRWENIKKTLDTSLTNAEIKWQERSDKDKVKSTEYKKEELTKAGGQKDMSFAEQKKAAQDYGNYLDSLNLKEENRVKYAKEYVAANKENLLNAPKSAADARELGDSLGLENLASIQGKKWKERWNEAINGIKVDVDTAAANEKLTKVQKQLKNFKKLSGTRHKILINAVITGEEKVKQFNKDLQKEFGDNNEVKKTAIIQAEAAYADGRKGDAKDILKKAGFNDKDTEEITKNYKILTNVVNKDDINNAIDKQIGGGKGKGKGKGGRGQQLTRNVKLTYTGGKVSDDAKPGTQKGEVLYNKKDFTKGGLPGTQKAGVWYDHIVDQQEPSDKTAGLTYNVSFTGGKKSKSVKLTVTALAKGMNNIFKASPIPTLGSLAKGNNRNAKTQFGKVGPSGKGGLTLTGEEGYEIAWIPSESRSMILGAEGPQMVNLPKEAVVWTHEQSKKIMGQKAIPAGSHEKYANGHGAQKRHNGGSGGSGGSNSSNSSNSSNGTDNKKEKETTKEKQKQTKELKKHGKLSVYIYNMTQKIEQVDRKIETLQRKINKQLEKTSVTLKGVIKTGNQEIKRLNQSIKLNKQLEKYYKRQLKRINNNGKKSRTTITWENPTKERTKSDGKWSKWSKGTKKHTAKINLGKYIIYDPSTGAYLLDKKAINNVAKKDKNKAKAIRDKAQEKIDKYTEGRDQARDKIRDAQDKLDELTKKLYETFLAWENELTKIFNLTQKINNIDLRKNMAGALGDLNDSLIKSGMSKASDSVIKQSLDFYRQQMKLELNQIKKRQSLIKEQKKAIDDLISTKDEETRLARVKKNLKLSKAQDKAQSKLNKDKNTVKTYNQNRKKAKAASKDKKEQLKRISDAKIILNDKKASKKDKERAKKQLKDARAKLKQDNKILKYNSTKTITGKKGKKNYNKAKKDLKDQKKLETKKKNAEKTIKKLSKKKNLSKSEKKELADAKKKLASAKKGLAQNAKSRKLVNAYEAKNRKQSNKDRLKKAKNALKKAKMKHLSPTEVALRKEEVKQIQEEIKNTKTAQKYVKTTKNADGTVSVNIDSAKLERDKEAGKISNKEYEFIKNYYDKIEQYNNELQESYQAQVDAIAEMANNLTELKEEYASEAENLLQGLETLRQNEIDRLDKLNESLSKALKDLLDKVKEGLDLRRQEEDNKETEDDITSKQQRLAALRADNAGGNAKEIKQLEKEIADAQKSYGRTLEDQALEKLQDQADKAEQQREKQIQLLTTQLEYQKQTGILAAEVNKWLGSPEEWATQIKAAWYADKNYVSMTQPQRAVVDANFEEAKANLLELPTKIKDTETAINDAKNILNKTLTDIYKAMNAMTGESGDWIINYRNKNSNGDMSAKGGTTGLSAGAWAQREINNAGGNYTVKDWFRDAKENDLTEEQTRAGAAGMVATPAKGKYKDKDIEASSAYVNALGTKVANVVDDRVYFQNLNDDGSRSDINGYVDINKVQNMTTVKNNLAAFKEAFKNGLKKHKVGTLFNPNAKELVKTLGVIGKTYTLKNGKKGKVSNEGKIHYPYGNKNEKGVKVWDLKEKGLKTRDFSKINKKQYQKWAALKNVGSIYKEVNQNRKKDKKLKSFKKGGVANFTGPAWLDGTKSKPELVLNAQDTANFLALKDVLSKAVSGTNNISNVGDTNYDIDINVDHIANDYDVDKIADKVKKEITKSAGYRNVNAVRNMR